MSNNTTLPVAGIQEKEKSGATTPADARSVFGSRPRSNTETTLVSSIADDSRSVSTTNAPNVPVNSPVSGSIAGDAVHAPAVIERVKTLTPMSDDGIVRAGEQAGKTHLEAKMETAVSEGVPESTNWAGEAVEMATVGLKRLVQLAKDENAQDPSKSVEQYYSEHLNKVIKEVGIEINAMVLEGAVEKATDAAQ